MDWVPNSASTVGSSTLGSHLGCSHPEASRGQMQETCQGPGVHKVGGELVCCLELKLTPVLFLLQDL